MSHLLQMRGLKLFIISNNIPVYFVASFTDAWIETFEGFDYHCIRIVASFTDAWIETLVRTGKLSQVPVASFTDAWIET